MSRAGGGLDPLAPAPSCARCETTLEPGDLRCAVCALPTPIAPRAVAAEAPARAQILRCTECGAAVGFSPTARAPHCGFCSAVMVIEQPSDPIEVARVRLPFAVDHAQAETALRGWLGRRGWFAPRTLRDEAVLESLAPLCWAAWLVNADATVAWTADSNRGAIRSDWAPHAGQVRLTFADLIVSASRGLRADECRALVPHYDLGTAIPIDALEISGGQADMMIESFDAQRSAARAEVHRGIERTAKVRVEAQIPGSRFRNIHVACMLEDEHTERVALPAWVLAYRYRGKAYRAVVHGQRPEIVLGKSPLDWGKLGRLAGGLALAIAAIVAIVLATGCKREPAAPDARDFTERCAPDGTTFAPLTGRAAVQGILNVHVDAGGLVMADTTASILLVMDLAQAGTSLGVIAQVCAIRIPDIPVPGQEKPIQFQIPDSTVLSVGSVAGTGTLSSADETCAALATAPITLVLGAKLDPVTTAPLPVVDDNALFPTCLPSATTPCREATGTNCACDQESDGLPGATLIARNVPAVDLDEVYATVRTTFSLAGQVFGTDSVKGVITASLEQGILACRLSSGNPCIGQDLKAVRNLNPAVTQQPDNPSTFRAVRVAPGATCADLIATESVLFPR